MTLPAVRGCGPSRPALTDEAMVRRSGVMKVAALLGALVLAGCRNCGGGTNMVETRFRVAPETQSVDFGRVLEGALVTKQVTLIAETRASVSVGATTMTPFSTAPPHGAKPPGRRTRAGGRKTSSSGKGERKTKSGRVPRLLSEGAQPPVADGEFAGTLQRGEDQPRCTHVRRDR